MTKPFVVVAITHTAVALAALGMAYLLSRLRPDASLIPVLVAVAIMFVSICVFLYAITPHTRERQLFEAAKMLARIHFQETPVGPCINCGLTPQRWNRDGCPALAARLGLKNARTDLFSQSIGKANGAPTHTQNRKDGPCIFCGLPPTHWDDVNCCSPVVDALTAARRASAAAAQKLPAIPPKPPGEKPS